MVQWINVLWNNSFVNLSWLPFCDTGAIVLVQLGLTAGRLADKMLLHLKIFKIKIYQRSERYSVIIVVLEMGQYYDALMYRNT